MAVAHVVAGEFVSEAVLEVDHLRYIKFRPYRRKTAADLRGLKGGHLYAMDVLHEHNGSCCRREPWATTFAKLIQSLNDDGLSTLSVTA